MKNPRFEVNETRRKEVADTQALYLQKERAVARELIAKLRTTPELPAVKRQEPTTK